MEVVSSPSLEGAQAREADDFYRGCCLGASTQAQGWLNDRPMARFCEAATPVPWPCGWGAGILPYLLVWSLVVGLAVSNETLVDGTPVVDA